MRPNLVVLVRRQWHDDFLLNVKKACYNYDRNSSSLTVRVRRGRPDPDGIWIPLSGFTGIGTGLSLSGSGLIF